MIKARQRKPGNSVKNGPTDQRLIVKRRLNDWWTRAQREENPVVWTLAKALGLRPEANDVHAFVEDLWVAVSAQDKDALPTQGIPGAPLRRAIKIAKVFDSMFAYGELQMPARDIDPENGYSAIVAREVEKEDQRVKADQRTADRVDAENNAGGKGGRRGAKATIAGGSGVHRSTVTRALQRLEQRKAIEKMHLELKKKHGLDC